MLKLLAIFLGLGLSLGNKSGSASTSHDPALLLEDGASVLLLESGDRLLLE